MLNIIILCTIGVALILHRYLTEFWERQILPFNYGFLFFVRIFIILYIINFIRMFGYTYGILLSALSLFQFIHATFLWPFLLPTIKQTLSSTKEPKVNLLAYGGWTILVILLLILTIVSYFITDFKELYDRFHNFWDLKNVLILVTIIIFSNVVRIWLVKKITNSLR